MWGPTAAANFANVIQTRLRAAVNGIGQGAEFCDGRQPDEATAALVSDTAIGRMLRHDEAAKLIRRRAEGKRARMRHHDPRDDPPAKRRRQQYQDPPAGFFLQPRPSGRGRLPRGPVTNHPKEGAPAHPPGLW
jgi:hypothetical protein